MNLQQSDDDVLLDLETPALGDSLATGLDGDDDFDFLSGTDEAATKLDLARAYIDMGDTEGARDILDEKWLPKVMTPNNRKLASCSPV